MPLASASTPAYRLRSAFVTWRNLEQAALDAEHAVEAMGQAPLDPGVAALLTNAQQLRQNSDFEFATVVHANNVDEHAS
jgi:hypothetical protein